METKLRAAEKREAKEAAAAVKATSNDVVTTVTPVPPAATICSNSSSLSAPAMATNPSLSLFPHQRLQLRLCLAAPLLPSRPQRTPRSVLFWLALKK